MDSIMVSAPEGGASLGINYEIAVHNDIPSVIRRYMIQRSMAELLPEMRVSGCMRHIVPGHQARLLYSSEHKRAHYGGLMVCGSVWTCPICAAKVSERRTQELIKGLMNWSYGLVLVTFTLRHQRDNKLMDVLGMLDQAYYHLVSGRGWQDIKARYGLIGSVKSLEITYSRACGWHPHRHVLMFAESPMCELALRCFSNDVEMRYLKILNGCGGSGIAGIAVTCEAVETTSNLVAAYMAKWEHEPVQRPWGVESELGKGVSKKAHAGSLMVWDLALLAAGGDLDAGERVREYAAATKGKRFVEFSNGLRHTLSLGAHVTDEQLA